MLRKTLEIIRMPRMPRISRIKNKEPAVKLFPIRSLHRLLLALIKIPFRRQKWRSSKNSDDFVRQILFLRDIFGGEKDQILIEA